MSAIPAAAAVACRTIIFFLLWIGRRAVTRRRERVASQRHQRCRGSIRRSNMTTNVSEAHRLQPLAREAIFLPWRRTFENIAGVAELALFCRVRNRARPPSPATGLKPAAPRCKISPLPRHAPPREHDEQG